MTVGENGPPQRGSWWFSKCLCLDSVLHLSFHVGVWETMVLLGITVYCEAWTVSECCVTLRQSHGGIISSADSLAVLFLMPHPLASPGTVFCRGLAWFTEKRSSAGTQAFPFLPKRLFCRSKAAPWRCISRIYGPAESVWERYSVHWGWWWWRGRWDRGREAFDAFRKEHRWGFRCVSLVSPQPFVSKASWLELAYWGTNQNEMLLAFVTCKANRSIEPEKLGQRRDSLVKMKEQCSVGSPVSTMLLRRSD